MRTQWTGRVVTDTIGDAVEDLRRALEWSDEANALGDVECDYDSDDQWGWLTMGPVRVEWTRDMHGDGASDWVAVQVSCNGIPMDDYAHLDDAVKAAAHRTPEWQEYRADDLRDEIIAWLEQRGESFDVLGPQDVHDAWTITWREVMIRGYFTEDDGAFEWSVMNPENADYLDGGAEDDVIEAIERVATDPMTEAWNETITDLTAEDDWSVRVSDDGMSVWMSEPTYTMSRRAVYERMGFGEGQIEMEHRLRIGEWRPVDEHLPEDEEDVRRMAREAYEWVKAVSD